MTNDILILIGVILVIFWGISHLIPIKSVVEGFGEISQDNKRIIQMEWIIEGFKLIFIAVLVVLVTILGGSDNIVSSYVYRISSIMLLILAVLSLFTGARVSFLPFKLCPIIFTISTILILLGSFL